MPLASLAPRVLLGLTLTLLSALIGCRAAPAPAELERSTAVRGVALGLFATDPHYDYRALVAEIAERGATDVLVVVPWYQAHINATEIAPRPGYSPADATVEATLRAVAARGLRPGLLPIVRLARRGAGEWRGVLQPAGGPDEWFGAYRRFIERMAELARRGGAVRLYIGSELGAFEGHREAWLALISATRSRFPGRLAYSANWDRFDSVSFWDAVDEIGVTGYFPMPSAEPEALRSAWEAPMARLEALSQSTGKPLVITEVGYPSRPTATGRPWDDAGSASAAPALQADLWRGFCAAFKASRGLRGFYAWNWFGVGGPRDSGYTLRGKPAAAVLSACFAGAGWRAR